VDRISLLPPEIKQYRQEREKKNRIQFLILLFLIFIAVINIFFLVNNLLLRGNLDALRQEREFVERQAADLTEFTDLYVEISASEQLLTAALGTVPQWSAFFRNVSQALPVTAWFSDLTATYSDQAGVITIRGWSYDHASLADLLERLEEIEQLDQVQCRVSTETIYQGTEAIQFQVDAILLSGPGFINEEEGGE
jgi:Tfp pilus assembly protein PilN